MGCMEVFEHLEKISTLDLSLKEVKWALTALWNARFDFRLSENVTTC